MSYEVRTISTVSELVKAKLILAKEFHAINYISTSDYPFFSQTLLDGRQIVLGIWRDGELIGSSGVVFDSAKGFPLDITYGDLVPKDGPFSRGKYGYCAQFLELSIDKSLDRSFIPFILLSKGIFWISVYGGAKFAISSVSPKHSGIWKKSVAAQILSEIRQYKSLQNVPSCLMAVDVEGIISGEYIIPDFAIRQYLETPMPLSSAIQTHSPSHLAALATQLQKAFQEVKPKERKDFLHEVQQSGL